MLRFKKFLVEGKQNYEAMFSAIWKKHPMEKKHEKDVAFEIKWAKRILKKNDRIVWWLKIIRKKLVKNVLPDEELFNKYKRDINNNLEGSDAFNPTILVSILSFPNWHVEMEHYYSSHIPEIDNFVFKNESLTSIIVKFTNREAEWRAQLKNDGIKKEAKIFLRVDSKFAWYDLENHTNPEEAKAMGHCANGPHDCTILSLREKTKKGYVPHLTFIYDPRKKLLGEMKGRGNDKPIPKYHKYIVPLLKDKRIRGFEHDALHHKPENNFWLSDLPSDLALKLSEQKPGFLSLEDLIKMATKKPGDKIYSTVAKKIGGGFEYVSSKKVFRVGDDTYNDILENHFPGFRSMTIWDKPKNTVDFFSKTPTYRFQKSNEPIERMSDKNLDRIVEFLDIRFSGNPDYLQAISDKDKKLYSFLGTIFEKSWDFESYESKAINAVNVALQFMKFGVKLEKLFTGKLKQRSAYLIPAQIFIIDILDHIKNLRGPLDSFIKWNFLLDDLSDRIDTKQFEPQFNDKYYNTEISKWLDRNV